MASTEPLDRLLRPRSIAIVGASEKPGALGTSLLGNLERFGYDGAIHLINPNRDAIGDRRCLRTIAELPHGVDAAVLAIPRAAVLDAVRALGARGVGSVVIFAAGFAEGGEEGLAEQREIARIAAETGMTVEGPNCLGLINFVDGIPLTFIETAPAPPATGPAVGIVSQSGAIAAVLNTVLLARGLGLSCSISTGNEAATGVEDFVERLVDDPHTGVIGMVVEQFRRPARFLAAAERARAAGKPIVLLHPGRSSAARESAATHTGALAGDHAVMSAKVRRAGVILVETLEELGDCLELLARAAPVGRAGPAVIGESGAFKALTLDFAEAIGLPLPAADDTDAPGLRAALPSFVPVSNPVDLTAQGLVEPAIYGRLIAAAMGDARFGAVMIGIIQTDAVTSGIKFPAIIDALARERPTKAVVVCGLDEGAALPPDYIAALRGLGIVYLPSTERALRALAILRAHAGAAVDGTATLRPLSLAATVRGMVPEHRAKALLAPLGIPFPAGQLATSLDEAIAAAETLGYPVVLKAQAVELPHKSDAGGVVVNLADRDALTAGWNRLQQAIARNRPDLRLDGVLVERMGAGGEELIIGARNDPDWGPVILVGFGGVQAEVLRDSRLIVPGLDRAGIVRELLLLKGAPLLTGFRGRPPVDLDAVAAMVETLGDLLTGEPAIREIDLNPVIVRSDGAVALDALILADA
ncbi:MAG: CoA-binding protein [Sphingomonas taxi]|uniref:CoA-binding protein n=1 Tax=Sphingomonas taxi TaxID=1549858 RepID=A0A2W5R8I7_9SPHN|nr:MAG: CoA-binding protein [Sphingomonas taxi]